MPRGRPQIEIGKRTYEEIQRIFDSDTKARRSLGITGNRLMQEWMHGGAPSAKYLQRLHFCGADVIYILTGVRK
jgi:hypothetical protein